jgi:integrase
MRAYRKLTQRDIDTAKPRLREYTHWDFQLPGFGLRVRPSGACTYVLVYRTTGRKQRRYTIGKPSVFSLDQARKTAREVAHNVAIGFDPAENKAKARSTTVETVYSQYEELRMSGLSQGHQVRVSGIFQSIIIPKLGAKPIGAVTRSDVRDLTDRKIASGAKAMANNVHRAMSAFLTWCIDREFINVNPLYGSDLPHRHRSRDRYLSREELVAIWHACDQLDIRWRAAIRLLILTGQRKSEVLGAELREFNLPSRIWVIPSERSKNRFPHTVHLSPSSLAIIENVPRLTLQRFLFQSHITRQPRPVTETNSPIRKLKGLVPVRNWRLHDLRRSVATHMAKLQVQPHVIEVVLNHRSGFRSGVGAIYNRYQYEQEARNALNLWADTLHEWLANTPSDILTRIAADEEVVI